MEEGNVQYVDSPVTVSWLSPIDRRGADGSDMRGYTWTVFRSDGVVQCGGDVSRDELYLHG